MMIVIRGRGIQIRGDEVPIGPPLSQSICRHLLVERPQEERNLMSGFRDGGKSTGHKASFLVHAGHRLTAYFGMIRATVENKTRNRRSPT